MTLACLVVCFNLPLLTTLLVCCFEFITSVRFCYYQNYPEIYCDYFGQLSDMVYLFKNDTVVSDFSDYFCKSLENENTLAIER